MKIKLKPQKNIKKKVEKVPEKEDVLFPFDLFDPNDPRFLPDPKPEPDDPLVEEIQDLQCYICGEDNILGRVSSISKILYFIMTLIRVGTFSN